MTIPSPIPSQDPSAIPTLLGQMVIKSGLLENFGLSPKALRKKDKEGLLMLAGFLKEAAEGEIGDPVHWHQKGARLLKEIIVK